MSTSRDFRRYGLGLWAEFPADFLRYWPTDGDHVNVDYVRGGWIVGVM